MVAKDRVFRDPVHGLIEFRGDDRPIAELLETRAMQRLRRIKQMGFASLVYPGAEHSRFGHALGAFRVAQKVCEQLGLPTDVARHVKVAALLHDIGHGPFSHAWEHTFRGGAGDHLDHEHWGARIVSEDRQLAAALEAIEPGLAASIRGFWDKTYRPTYARKLVSSQLDVDRLDYLLRDGHYSGAGYATFDLEWILHALDIGAVRSGADAEDLVVDYRRGMYAVEQYLFARSYMYAQVYHHKTVRAAEWMFIKLLERFAELARQRAEPPGIPAAARLARGEPIEVRDYGALHDVAVSAAIDRWAGHTAEASADDPVLRDLAARVAERRLFKTFDLGDDAAAAATLAPIAAEVAARLFGAAGNYYVHVDSVAQVGYRGGDDELYVVGHPRYGQVTLGQLLADMPLGHPKAAIRVVCAPELVEDLRPHVERVLRAR